MTLVEKALRLSVEAHKNQIRKGDSSPYIVHPVTVALMLRQHGFSDEVVAAGLVHDVLEDTSVLADTLRAELGEEVFEIVRTVSEDKSLAWEERKKNYIEAVRQGSDEAKAVSIADKIHNVESMLNAYAKEGDVLWQKFSRGKDKQLWFEEEMLAMLKASWQHPLLQIYGVLVERMRTL